MPADCLVKVFHREILYEKTLSQATRKVVHRSAWQAQQQGSRKHCRRASYTYTSGRCATRRTSTSRRRVGNHVLRALCKQSCLIQTGVDRLHTWRKATLNTMPFSEESKEMIQKSRNVKGFEVRQASEQAQCPYCMRNPMRGVVHCDCGSCLVPSDQVRQRKKERFDVFMIPFFTFKKRNSSRVLVWSIRKTKSILSRQERWVRVCSRPFRNHQA